MSKTKALDKLTGLEVAVIGMICRFPGANSIDDFWLNLRDGVESLSVFSDEDIIASGENPALLNQPNYVRAGTFLDGVELFDASFFEFTPREAELTDPQQRLFLESAWEALESSGYYPETFKGRIGLFAGVSMSSYLINCFLAINGQDGFNHQTMVLGNDKDFLPTRVSYKMNLTGPSVNVQSACSTSLVAVHLAVQSLLSGECEMALAGGVSVHLPQKTGYLCVDGFVFSHDGHCRAFDANADGCVGSNGLGIVVLKRLDDALASGDHIRAVIKGSAINNDGSSKIGYTAPSIAGQARVIRAAQIMAEVEPETISYIEAHGTATPLGDPIEVAALTQAFRANTQRKGFCAIGSVKTNIGHTDAAAGVAGLIKTVLSLEHEMIPPSLNFEKPNPQISFDDSPFYVADRLIKWRRNSAPRRAGVSSFGLGGTNAHVVLEEAPAAVESEAGRECQLLLLSGRTRAALETVTSNLENHLRLRPELNLADVAYTLQTGRRHFKYRRMIFCQDLDGALRALESCKLAGAVPVYEAAEDRPVVFMFPGGGTQYVNMGAGLYQSEPVFRQQIDVCCEILEPHLGYDLRSLLYPPPEQSAMADERLRREAILPSIFVTEYALAKLWMSWGICPQAMIGHSLGEYVAACLAGVFSLEDALSTTVMRTKLLHRLRDVGMLIVLGAESEVRGLMGEELSLAAVNGPSQCVVAGPVGAISQMQDSLSERRVEYRRLHAASASHCEAVMAVLDEFLDHLNKLNLKAPALPYVSNLTGTWITAQEATDPDYWARHLRQTVRFADGIKELSKDPARVLLEVGPGNTLSTLAKLQADNMQVQPLSSIRHPRDEQPDVAFTMNTLGKLWASGVQVDWSGLYANEHRRRVPLPTYPFERQRYWIEPRKLIYAADGAVLESGDDSSAACRDRESTVQARIESLDGMIGMKYPRPPLPTVYVAPKGRTQEQVADMWQRLFKIEPIGADDNFFELGGDSLLAIQLISRLREAFRIEIPVRSLFEARTVALVAEVIDKLQRDGGMQTAPPLVPAPRVGPLPLSFGQQRLWFLDQLEPQNPFYNQTATFRASGPLNTSAMQRALNEIVKRHEVLRTSFVVARSQPVQEIAPYLEIKMDVRDLRHLSSDVRNERALNVATAEALHPFNLSQAPLLRALLLRLDEEDWVIVLVIHHIIADGWSLKILINEMEALYTAYSAGEKPSLPELPIQYADYAIWQQEWLRGDALAEHLSYWKGRLAGAPAALELPTDRPRPHMQSYRGARQFIEIPADIAEELKQWSMQENASLFMTMLAAFSTLLYRYSGQEDIVIGSPIANRSHVELEGLIGFFVNTLVLRTDLTGEPSFKELVRRVREFTLSAYEHQDMPFEKLVEELRPGRDLSRSPVFQVMFSVEANILPAPDITGVVFTAEDSDIPISKFDLTLTINEYPQAMVACLSYSTDLFDAPNMERLLGSFQSLLGAVAEDPESPIWALPILSEQEKKQLLLEWNDTAVAYDGDECVHQIFERQVERTPDAVALVQGDTYTTYRELNTRANRLAHYLRKQGAARESVVGVCLPRSREMIVALLSCIKAGAAYLPLDPSYPQQRLAFMLEDANVRTLITLESLTESMPSHAAHAICLDRDREVIADRDDNPAGAASGDNPAYVIYTSGSTGLPKATLVEHRGLRNLSEAQISAFGITSDSRVLQFASFSFDASVSEVFTTLLTGAALCLLEDGQSFSTSDLLRVLREQAITTVTLPPSVLALMQAGSSPELRTIVAAGEPCSAEIVRRWSPGRRFLNAYGPTETTVCATIGECDESEIKPSIGCPISNTKVYVLDRYLQPVPIGVTGELSIAGAGLARGYLNQPELTAAKFVPDPFSAQPGARLYATGDLARYLGDGRIEFVGRVDHQVKVRGFRIELTEIEEVLKRHVKIKEAIATTCEGSAGESEIVAYIVPDEGKPPATADLRQYLKERLPQYMLPSAYVLLENLPLTISGKVDRSMLPAPDGTRPQLEKPFIAPQTMLEQMLAEMWQRVLGIGQVGIYDNFFELGGSSIKAALFINELQARLGDYVYVVALFDTSNIFELAAYLAKHYPEAVERIFEGETSEKVGSRRASNIQSARMTRAEIARIRELVKPVPGPADGENTSAIKNPSAVFILSAPRSGSTLLRVMLGGHPMLFAPPELELLSFKSLRQRREAFTGKYSFWLEGTLRALMNIRDCDAEEAGRIMQGCEDRRMTTREFYRLLQSWIGERKLVDKTPSYALDLEVLNRAEEYFDNALYIHLVRHPMGMIASFEEAKLDQVFFRYQHDFNPTQLAELIWTVSQQNIVEFLSGVPPGRQCRVAFEHLVKDPERVMAEVCRLIGVDFNYEMMEPYKEKAQRMTDGIHPLSKMLGDLKFHEHKSIDAKAAERWTRKYRDYLLGEETLGIAKSFGYETGSVEDASSVTSAGTQSDECISEPRSDTEDAGNHSRPELHKVLIGIQSGGPNPPLILIPPMGGNVFSYRDLTSYLGREQAIYALRPRGLDGSGEPFDSVEEEARCYVEALRTLQSEGPYLLVGTSYGGVIAFEMAQQLCAQRRRIGLLAMIDTPAPGNLVERAEDPASMLASFLSSLIGDDAFVSAEYLRQLEPDDLMSYCFEKLKLANKLPANNGLCEAKAILRVCQANARAMLNYAPRSCSERITYFGAADRIEGQPRYPELPWIELAGGGIEIHRVPGNHYSLLNDPHVKVLAQRLNHCLEQLSHAVEKPAGGFQMVHSMGGAAMQSAPGENHA